MKLSSAVVCAVAVLLLAAASPAFATISAKVLKNECMAEMKHPGDTQQGLLSAAETAFKLGHCTGYIAGFMDATNNVRDGVSVKQIEDAFIQYVQAHPAEEDSTAWWILDASARSAGLTYKK